VALLKIEKLNNILKRKIKYGNINYVVPDMWNAWNYSGKELRKLPSQELLVNPYLFYSSLIEEYILPNKKNRKNYSKSLSEIKNIKDNAQGGDWIRKSVLYSLMIRTSSAWDHDRSFSLDLSNFNHLKETGTFVKTLALLPLLKKMGVDTLYLLPISRFSLKDKKGELGSPYGVANFFDLDPNLKETMTGKEMSLEEEFQALVEACHILDMRVIIDIIPRTNSVDNDLIKDHPDWFYWIKKSEAHKYKVPYVDGLGNTIPPTDVTFFRMFMDHPKATKQYLKSKSVNPYILFDTIKANLFPGEIPNQELWNLLSSIIPHYQKKYGIDGARIDMGHALPEKLLEMIINKARENNHDFAFIAEELNPDNAKKAKDFGYNIIIGNGFWMEPRVWEKKLHKFVYGLKDISLPMFASCETHDSARIAGRDGGRVLARMITILNMLLPNSVPFINSGQEVYETQPMNLGVDCSNSLSK